MYIQLDNMYRENTFFLKITLLTPSEGWTSVN